MISLVMATYNGGKYLDEQLLSIKNQKLKPDEIVVVDDGSKDHTLRILETFKKENPEITFKIIVNEENLGPAKTFAKGILETCGDLIFLCDQDDIWFEHKIYEMDKIFREKPSISVLCTDYQIYVEKEDKYINNSSESNKLIPFSLIDVLHGNIAPGCTSAFRGTLRKEFAKINEQIYIHDWFINVIAARDQGLYLYEKTLMSYRIHSNNTLGLNLTFASLINRNKNVKDYKHRVDFYHALVSLDIVRQEEDLSFLKRLIEQDEIRLNFLKGEISLIRYLKEINQKKVYVDFKKMIYDIIQVIFVKLKC